MALSCTVSEIKRDIGRKITIFFIHSAFDLPPRYGGPQRNIAILFGVEKLEWSAYPMVIIFDDMFSHFDRTPVCDGRTDGRTDGHLATT